MKKHILAKIILLIFLNLFGSYAQESNALRAGEFLKYRIHLGFINAAEATIKTSFSQVQVNQIPSRKVEIEGKTIGLLHYLSPLVDYWSASLDVSTLLPIKTELKKIEGKYRKEENVYFNTENNTAKIYSKQNDPNEKTVSIPKGTVDLIGGYYYLRNKVLSDMKIGQKLNAKILVEGTIYEVWFIVKDFEKIDTKFGKRNCIRTSLVMPKNNLFEDKDAIRLWISQDDYQIPIKMEVSLKIGFLGIDLEEYNIMGKRVY
ncbi:DUF3108 domain-containing protein [Aquirufa sp. ROCK2-A2]